MRDEEKERLRVREGVRVRRREGENGRWGEGDPALEAVINKLMAK